MKEKERAKVFNFFSTVSFVWVFLFNAEDIENADHPMKRLSA